MQVKHSVCVNAPYAPQVGLVPILTLMSFAIINGENYLGAYERIISGY